MFRTTLLQATRLSVRSLSKPCAHNAVVSRAQALIVSSTARSPAFTLAARVLASQPARQQARFASSNSSQPSSKDAPSAIRGAAEEVRHVAGDLAKSISGGQTAADLPDDPGAVTRTQLGHNQGMSEDFVSLTSSIASHVPRHVLVFGLAGGLPYLATSISTLYLARQAAQATAGEITSISPEAAFALLDSCSHLQVTYGAVLLSFIGALQWGFEFAGYNGHKGYPRLVLGVLPLLGAWSTLGLQPTLALAVQWGLFTGTWYADMKTTTLGWSPKWYSQYRFYLSLLVGSSIILTLGGLNYFGPTTDVVFAKQIKNETGVLGSSTKLMDRNIREKAEGMGSVQAKLPADAEITSEDAGEDGDAYVRLVKRPEPGSGEESDEAPSDEGTQIGTPGENAGKAGEGGSSWRETQGKAKEESDSKSASSEVQGNDTEKGEEKRQEHDKKKNEKKDGKKEKKD